MQQGSVIGWRALLSTTLWSSVFVTSFIVVAGTIFYTLLPQDMSVQMNAGTLADGTRDVTLRAVNPNNFDDVLYSTPVSAEIADGVLSLTTTPPKAAH